MTEQTPKDFFHVLAAQEQDQHAVLASDALLGLSEELVGDSTPKGAVEVAFNLLHPDAAIQRRHWPEVRWAEQATPERQAEASQVLGTLALAQAYTDKEGALINRTVIGLPSMESSGEIPELKLDELTAKTGLRNDRVIQRRYEALKHFAEIWEGAQGLASPDNFLETKRDLTSKIIETYGQVGYGLITAMYKKGAIHPFLYLDRVFNGDNPDNPLRTMYSSGIAGYNRHAKNGRDAIIKHLEETDFVGSQAIMDSETSQKLTILAANSEKVQDIAMNLIQKSAQLTDVDETLALVGKATFTQVEAFKVAELNQMLTSYKPKESSPTPSAEKVPKTVSERTPNKLTEIVEMGDKINLIVEAYRSKGLSLPIGVRVVKELLDGRGLKEIGAELGNHPTKPWTHMNNGLTTIRRLLNKVPDPDVVTLETFKRIVTAPKVSGPSGPQKPGLAKKRPGLPSVSKEELPKDSPLTEPIETSKIVVGMDPTDDIGRVSDYVTPEMLFEPGTPEYVELSGITYGTGDKKQERFTRTLNYYAAAYELGDFDGIPDIVRKALDVFYGVGEQ